MLSMSYNQINKYLGSGKYHYHYLQGREVKPFFMYLDIFNCGEDLEDRNTYIGCKDNWITTSQYNLICMKQDYDTKRTLKIIIHKDLQELKDIIDSNDNNFYWLSPNSYCGKSPTKQNARFMYAFVFDLDDIVSKKDCEDEGLRLLDNFYIYHNRVLIPNYIVSSGNGIHLYYILKEPIPLKPSIIKLIEKIKFYYVKRYWTTDISIRKPEYNQKQITQGFRVGGTKTKYAFEHNMNRKTKCFYFSKERYTLNDFAKCINLDLSQEDKDFCNAITINVDTDTSHLKLEDAKKKYPEWYKKRIIEKKDKLKLQDRPKWNISPKLYNWWLRQYENATYHHRYWYCYFLVIYAIKCDVPKEQVKQDLYDIQPILNNLDREHPFTISDIESALNAYESNKFLWTRQNIEHYTQIDIPPNKRNGLKREEHLELARHMLEIKNKRNGKALQGRKPKNNEYDIYDYILQESDKEKDIAQKFNISVRQARRYKKKLREL